MNPDKLKIVIKEKYGLIANQDKPQNSVSCCSETCGCEGIDFTSFSDDYSKLEGYNPDADLGLGCGTPTEFAGIRKGQRVLDLGSGAGNDCFVARSIVGESGSVTGIDFTDEMIKKAIANANKLGFTNINFVKGDIESMPLPESTFDVVISNCVLNLVPNKTKAFSEIHRVLKPKGHFCVSDIVLKGTLPDKLKHDAELYAGCVSGALQLNEYIEIIAKTGFKNIDIKKEKAVNLPTNILNKYLTDSEITEYQNNLNGIYSITVTGIKQIGH